MQIYTNLKVAAYHKSEPFSLMHKRQMNPFIDYTVGDHELDLPSDTADTRGAAILTYADVKLRMSWASEVL